MATRVQHRSSVTTPRPTPNTALLWVAAAATLVFALSTLEARGGSPEQWELTVFQAVNGLPDWLYFLIWPFMQYGVFVTIPIAALVAFVMHRRRLAVLLATSGVSIYVAAKLVKLYAQRGRPMAFLEDVAEREHFARSSLGYTSGHVAVAATIATLTMFHLPRSLQRVTVALVVIVAFGRMYVGAHLPIDMLGAIGMGVATGCLVTYFFGGQNGKVGVAGGTFAPSAASDAGRILPDMGTALRPHKVAEPATGDTASDPHSRTSRHPGDIVRVLLGAAILAIGLLVVQRQHVTVFEVDVFRLVNHLPTSLNGVFVAVMQLGNLFAGPIAAVAALVIVRRFRPALDLMISGPLAWLAARLIKTMVQRPRPGGIVEDVARYGSTDGLGFVSGHAAVATALITAIAPFLPRTWRRVAWVLPFAVGAARVYEGAHLPMDIVGGMAVGWAVGSIIHVVIGAPHRIPTATDAAAVLRKAGWSVTAVTPVGGSPRGSFPFVAQTSADEQVFVKLLDPEPRDRDWLFRAARFLVVRDVRDQAAIDSADAQADHEAAMSLLARCHGVRVPILRRIEHAGVRRWLVQDYVPGTSLDRKGAEVTDAELRDAWQQVAALHRASLAHRDLVASNVLVDADHQVWLVDLAHTVSGAHARSLDNDIAELLVSTGLAAGAPRAVAAAAAVLGNDGLRAVLPELQPLTLTAENRRRLRSQPALLNELRAEVGHVTGLSVAPVPEPRAKHGWRATVASVIAVITLASLVAVGSPSDVLAEFASPGYRWLGLALLAAVLLVLCEAVTQAAATDRRLSLGRTALARLAAGTMAPIGGRRASERSLIRFLERSGVPAAAQGARRLWRARLATSTALLATAALIANRDLTAASLPDNAPMLAALFGAGVLVQLLGGWRHGPNAETVSRSEPLRPPMWTALTVSTFTEALLTSLCAVAAASAFGGAPSIETVVAIHLATNVIAALSPAGGAGAAEVAMAAGLSATGMPLGAAVAAALATRFMLFWLPLLLGRIVAPALRHRLVI